MIKDFFQYEFLQNAFWASLLSAIICGVIGVIISQKKLFMMAGGIAHTSYGGVAYRDCCTFASSLTKCCL